MTLLLAVLIAFAAGFIVGWATLDTLLVHALKKALR